VDVIKWLEKKVLMFMDRRGGVSGTAEVDGGYKATRK
jgi:hypothetical protein